MPRETMAVSKFIQLAHDCSSNCEEQDYQLANRLLDNIIAGEYSKRQRLPENEATILDLLDFIISGTCMLTKASVLLCSKFGQAIGLIIQNSKVELTEKCTDYAVRFFTSSLEQCRSSLAIELLNGLQITVNAYHGKLTEETMDVALGPTSPLWAILERELEINLQKACFNCVTALLPKVEDSDMNNKFYVKVSYQQLVNHLRILVNHIKPDDLFICKMVLNALKTLQNILEFINEKDGIIEPEIIIALLKVFTIYGMPGFVSRLSHLRKNLPTAREGFVHVPEDFDINSRKEKSPLCKKMVPSTKVKKKRMKNKSKKRETSSRTDNTHSESHTEESDPQVVPHEQELRMFHFSRSHYTYSSSESELSDAEAEASIGLVSCKVRQAAVRAIQGILRSIERKSKFSCWLLIVPESKSDIDTSLPSMLQDDPSPKVRVAALNALIELLNGSKIFLDMGIARSIEQTSTPRSFVSFSTKLSQSMDQLHDALLMSILKESQCSLLEKIVKCLTLVILNCPYDKLGTQWLKRFVPVLSKYLLSKDPNLVISVLTGLAAILSMRDRTGSLQALFQSSDSPLVTDILQKFDDSKGKLEKFGFSWLTLYCYRLMETSCISDDQISERYLSESLQVLTVILRIYPELINKHCRMSIVTVILSRLLKFSSVAPTFDAVKLMEEVGKHFANLADNAPNHICKDTLQEGIEFWMEVIPGPIVTMLQSSESAVKIKAATCDWVATIGPKLFPELKYYCQIICKTLLLGTSQDNDDQVKAAAVRALGVIVTFPCMKEDPAFIVDTGRIMMGYLRSSNVTLQMKAAWALGNLCDSCVKNRLLCATEANDALPEDFVYELLSTSVRVSTDNDKVKSNGVRAVGNLIRCLPKDMLEKERFQDVITKGAISISKNIAAGPMKGRWNACYACSNIFHNTDLDIELQSWQESVFKALMSSLKDCKNFKKQIPYSCVSRQVRIGATSALRTLNNRQRFGNLQLFMELWRSTLEALASSESMADLREFRYKDTLQTQICELICHFINLATVEDLNSMQVMIQEEYEVLTTHMFRYFGRTRLPAEAGISSNDETSPFITYTEKYDEWHAVKANLLKVKLSVEVESLVDKVNTLFV